MQINQFLIDNQRYVLQCSLRRFLRFSAFDVSREVSICDKLLKELLKMRETGKIASLSCKIATEGLASQLSRKVPRALISRSTGER